MDAEQAAQSGAGVGTTVTSHVAAIRALAPGFAEADGERLGVLYLDAERRLLGSAVFAGCARESIEVPARALFYRALQIDARAIIVAHNHPAGSIEPSAADLAVTRRLALLARGLGIVLVDHLILAGERATSFRERGLL